MSWAGLHESADAIFGITQRLLCIIHQQTWSGNASLIKDFFWTWLVASTTTTDH